MSEMSEIIQIQFTKEAFVAQFEMNSTSLPSSTRNKWTKKLNIQCSDPFLLPFENKSKRSNGFERQIDKR